MRGIGLFVGLLICCGGVYFVGMIGGFKIGREYQGTASTWIDDMPAGYDAAELRKPEHLGRHLSNIAPPSGWHSSPNDSTARLVTDKVTGEQVLVINGGWKQGSTTMYRILRRVRIEYSDFVGGDVGWEYDRHRIADFWVAEERRLEELAPIPSA